ncbi:MAG TPA: type II toxin-antitoxin system death-on-curing family toxin [Actinoplanes sp.]
MTEYLEVDDVVRIAQIAVRGGVVVRNQSVLESAVGMPTMTMFSNDLYPDLASKAAALWYSIDHNQPFMDGNKRTAILAATTFLDINGHRVTLSDPEMYDLAMQVATNSVKDINGLATILRDVIEPI